MHTNSLPPSDRDTAPETTPAVKAPKIRPCNEALRQTLITLRASSPMYSNAQLGSKLGYSSAVVSQYLSPEGNKYPSNVAPLEKKIEDFLQARERSRASGVITCASEVADDMMTGFENIRQTKTLGLIIAPSGDGKTRGIELIQDKYPLLTLVEITEWCRSVHDVMRAMWRACAVDGWDGTTPQFAYLVQKWRGCDRPILFDDAHKASLGALSMMATFQEKTKCPMPLVGCEDLVDKIASDPQRLSRTFVCWTVKAAQDPQVMVHMIRSICKGINGELDDLAELCARSQNGHGHKRTVEQLLKGAARVREGDPRLSWCEAYQAAEEFSVAAELRRRASKK